MSDAPLRVGGDSMREEVDCPTCHGKGSYPIIVFEEPAVAEAEGRERRPIEVDQDCATCQATGKIWEIMS